MTAPADAIFAVLIELIDQLPADGDRRMRAAVYVGGRLVDSAWIAEAESLEHGYGTRLGRRQVATAKAHRRNGEPVIFEWWLPGLPGPNTAVRWAGGPALVLAPPADIEGR